MANDKHDPKISVVIATFNRCDILPKTLSHIAEQTLSPSDFEVVVVDDGSTDGTKEKVMQIQHAFSFHLTYLRHENRGISYTQNRGIREAKAPLVLLIADDIHLSPEALEAHVEDHEANPDPSVAIVGKVLQSPELAQTVFLRTWDPFRFRELEELRELPYYLFFACNISLKKSFLMENGLFSETLVKAGAYAHEDVELGFRLYQRGLRLLYNKNALAYHYHLVSLKQAVRTAYNKGVAWIPFRKHVDRPEMTVRYHVLHPRFLRDYRCLFEKENHLLGLDREPLLLMVSQMIRITLFNRLTVPVFWLPLMQLAEKHRFFSKLMHRQFYRCAISHHFHQGVADAASRAA